MKTILLTLAAVGGLIATPAFAATGSAPGSMAVTANVLASCAVSSTSTLDFGNLHTGTDINEQTAGSITFACTDTTPWGLTADNGANNASGQRQMLGADGKTKIAYNLYVDGGHATAFPVTGGSATPVSGTGDGDSHSTSIYGLVPALTKMPAPGAYSDTVQLTVTY